MEQLTSAHNPGSAQKLASFLLSQKANAVAGSPWLSLPAAQRGGLYLQVVMMEVDEYPRRFLAAVTAVPIGLGVELAAVAAEGVADSDTLGGILLAALRRLAATGNHSPYA